MKFDCPSEYIGFAAKLADTAGEIIRRHFRSSLTVDRKSDNTPVTIADRDAEEAMRRLIQERFPNHAILGEEFDEVTSDSDLCWILDPIDGTKSFISGRPIFGTLISLVHSGNPILGIIDQPILGERWIGAEGYPTTFNGKHSKSRNCDGLDDAILNTTSPDLFKGADKTKFARLSSSVWHTQYGGDCYAYATLASGFLDIVVEANLKAYDFCALAPVVSGSGGAISDWRGDPLTWGSDGRVAAVGDSTMLPKVIEVLSK